ncbi:hypothetical protein FGB62_1g521 [Gracilaria domingensis]|nr:hypothetical protein FGB62_1g521 [Gracilaria domingensis]
MGFLYYSRHTNTYHDSMVKDEKLTAKFFYLSMGLDGLDEQTQPLKPTNLEQYATDGIEIRTVGGHHALAAMLIETDIQVTDDFFAEENAYGIEGDVVIDKQSSGTKQLWTVSCHYGDIILVSEFQCSSNSDISGTDVEHNSHIPKTSRDYLIEQLKLIWDTNVFPDALQIRSRQSKIEPYPGPIRISLPTATAIPPWGLGFPRSLGMMGSPPTGASPQQNNLGVTKGEHDCCTCCSCFSGCFTNACSRRKHRKRIEKQKPCEETLKVGNVRVVLSNNPFQRYRHRICCLTRPSLTNTRYINGLPERKLENNSVVQRARAHDHSSFVKELYDKSVSERGTSQKKYSDTYRFGRREYVIEGNDLVVYITKPRTQGNDYTVQALAGMAETLPEVQFSVSTTIYGREKVRIVATNLLNSLSFNEYQSDRWQEFANNVIRCCSLGASDGSSGGCWAVLYGTPRRKVDINWFLKGSVAEQQRIYIVRTNSKVFITAGDYRPFYTVDSISPNGVVHVSDDTDSFEKLSPRTKLWFVDLKGLYLGGINEQEAPEISGR